jgi:hypothetical protein
MAQVSQDSAPRFGERPIVEMFPSRTRPVSVLRLDVRTGSYFAVCYRCRWRWPRIQDLASLASARSEAVEHARKHETEPKRVFSVEGPDGPVRTVSVASAAEVVFRLISLGIVGDEIVVRVESE